MASRESPDSPDSQDSAVEDFTPLLQAWRDGGAELQGEFRDVLAFIAWADYEAERLLRSLEDD